MSDRDPFSGTWVFCSERSQPLGQPPRRWVQTIRVEGDEITVKEESVFSAEAQPDIILWARVDGELYPVSGSPAADHVAYQRTGTHALIGTAYKEGRVCLREVLVVSGDGDELRMEYTLLLSDRELHGVAIFMRSDRD